MAVDFEAVNQVCRQYADDVRRVLPVDKVMLFGSYAKGTADEKSDIDICFFLDNYGDKGRFEIMVDLLYQVAPIREQLGITAMRKQCPQVFENTGFARVCKNFCASRLIPIKRNLVLGLSHRFKDAFFEPLVFETSELENDNPFVKEILRTGREI
ncbi:MAG: nucleotidyltransferase domain-containing protein [Holophagaceae bacterium]|nr:nucleotidyltransferase domain-containing protein [Holophagaceae bacterium]